jgi:hypothetical protein
MKLSLGFPYQVRQIAGSFKEPTAFRVKVPDWCRFRCRLDADIGGHRGSGAPEHFAVRHR